MARNEIKTEERKFREENTNLEDMLNQEVTLDTDVMDFFLIAGWDYCINPFYKKADKDTSREIRKYVRGKREKHSKGEKIKLKEEPEGDPDPSKALKGKRDACFAGKSREFVSTPVYDYSKVAAGNIIRGPGIIESPLNTVVIPPGSKGKIDQYLNIEVMVKAYDDLN